MVLGAPANSFTSEHTRCHSYWDETPLDAKGAGDFLAGTRDDDIAVMISAKSRTPLHIRRDAFRTRERS
jgi:hypothetical protein